MISDVRDNSHTKPSATGDHLFIQSSRDNADTDVVGQGDVIKNMDERKGRSGVDNSAEVRLFEDFILASNLVDVPCKDKRFSWYNGDGSAMSRID